MAAGLEGPPALRPCSISARVWGVFSGWTGRASEIVEAGGPQAGSVISPPSCLHILSSQCPGPVSSLGSWSPALPLHPHAVVWVSSTKILLMGCLGTGEPAHTHTSTRAHAHTRAHGQAPRVPSLSSLLQTLAGRGVLVIPGRVQARASLRRGSETRRTLCASEWRAGRP